jgi:glutathione S-transferase
MATLYRCKAPSDHVCRCGKVARRPEVEELTGRRWVPVLVHGDEVVSDSHRILEYLNWLQTQEVA